MRLLLSVFIFLTPFFSSASQYMSLGYEHNVDTDSSRSNVFEAQVASGRSDIHWLYPDEAEGLSFWSLSGKNIKGDSTGGEFSGQSVLLGYHMKSSSHYYSEIALGYHEQNVDSSDETHSFGVGRILSKALFFDKKLSLTAKVEKDLAYANLDVPASLTDFKRKTLYSLENQYRNSEKWRTLMSLSQTNYSDDNERNQYVLKLLYGVSTSWPWIWVGPFYDQLESSEQIIGYWTPEEFKSYGLQIEAAFPVWKELQANLELKAHRLKENQADWGDGHSVFVGLQYGKRGQANIQISFLDIVSSQEGTKWSQDTSRISYYMPF